MLKFSVIICNYNGQKYLRDCLSSVSKTDYPKFETIVVDDRSTDDSLQLISQFQKNIKIRLILNQLNLGLVRSRNKAIKLAQGEILVFLDNDTKVDKNWLKGLAEVFVSDQTIAAAQSKIFDYKKRENIQEIGMKLVPYTGFGATLGRGEKDRGQFSLPTEIVALGAALAVRKTVAKKIRGFDESIFHYTDDLDFSWRIWIAGYRVTSAPNSKVYHYTKVHPQNIHLYFHLAKNSFRMISKNYELLNLVKYLPFSLAFNLIGGVYVLWTQRSLMGILGVLLGIGWYIIYLPETLHQRSIIQNMRRSTDKDIMRKVMFKDSLIFIFQRYFKISRPITYVRISADE